MQAEGPRPRPIHIAIDDEDERPSAEILDCLAHLDFDGRLARLPVVEFGNACAPPFRVCVCLQLTRLRLTASCWRDALAAGLPDLPPDVGPRLQAAASWRPAGSVRQISFNGWFPTQMCVSTLSIPSNTVPCIFPYLSVTQSDCLPPSGADQTPFMSKPALLCSRRAYA